jgi:hypothetical protein
MAMKISAVIICATIMVWSAPQAQAEFKGCYERVYDKAYLSRHKKQSVVKMRLQIGVGQGVDGPIGLPARKWATNLHVQSKATVVRLLSRIAAATAFASQITLTCALAVQTTSSRSRPEAMTKSSDCFAFHEMRVGDATNLSRHFCGTGMFSRDFDCRIFLQSQ